VPKKYSWRGIPYMGARTIKPTETVARNSSVALILAVGKPLNILKTSLNTLRETSTGNDVVVLLLFFTFFDVATLVVVLFRIAAKGWIGTRNVQYTSNRIGLYEQ